MTSSSARAGSFEGVSSPIVPAEPFDFVDITLRGQISFPLDPGRHALVYVVQGGVCVRAGDCEQKLGSEQAVALYGGGGRVTFEAPRAARFFILSGAEIREPVVAQGPFVMNSHTQIGTAIARYRAGAMGRLDPLSAH